LPPAPVMRTMGRSLLLMDYGNKGLPLLHVAIPSNV
jgi:hypothetical protein